MNCLVVVVPIYLSLPFMVWIGSEYNYNHFRFDRMSCIGYAPCPEVNVSRVNDYVYKDTDQCVFVKDHKNLVSIARMHHEYMSSCFPYDCWSDGFVAAEYDTSRMLPFPILHFYMRLIPFYIAFLIFIKYCFPICMENNFNNNQWNIFLRNLVVNCSCFLLYICMFMCLVICIWELPYHEAICTSFFTKDQLTYNGTVGTYVHSAKWYDDFGNAGNSTLVKYFGVPIDLPAKCWVNNQDVTFFGPPYIAKAIVFNGLFIIITNRMLDIFISSFINPDAPFEVVNNC